MNKFTSFLFLFVSVPFLSVLIFCLVTSVIGELLL